jgi:hypothetical protein
MSVREEAEGAGAPVLRVRAEWADLLVGLALLGVTAYFLAASFNLEDYSGGAIGSADFPRGVALLLGLCLLFLFGGIIWRFARHIRQHAIVVRQPVKVAAGMLLLLVFPVAMRQVGYYPTMAVWLAAFLWLADYRRPVGMFFCIAGFLAMTKLVFEYMLSTPIP